MEQTPSSSESASLVSADATGSPTLDIFEVFKFGHASRQELEQMPLEQLRSRYTMLVPIDSKQQLQAAAELATVPKEGAHIFECFQFYLHTTFFINCLIIFTIKVTWWLTKHTLSK